ncbi:MAG: baseplate J/gp47 family protein [Candidatus Methanoperedens sp.]
MKISLPKPNLDDRTFNQLVEEAKKLIPRYAPQWTDHNWSDPGITFIDLFAWLTEMALYRINLVTDNHRLKYLQLLGIRPKPPSPAKVDFTFESKNDFKPKKDHLKAGAGESISVEIDASGKSIDFELDEGITVVPVTLEKVIVDAQTAGVFDRTDANKKADLFYAPFGLRVQKDCALYLGFDKSTDTNTQVYPSDILSFMCYLYEKYFKNEPAEHGNEPDYKFENAKLKWKITSDGINWNTISPKDETEGFKKSGRIIFKELKGWKKSKISKDNSNRDLFWLRCTVEESNFEYPPRIETIRLNTTSATQGRTIKDDNMDRRSNGLPYQVFKLNNTPILDKTVELESDEYLFNWDEILEKDKDKVKQYLKNRFSMNWVEDAEIKQINKYNIKLYSNDNCILFNKYKLEETCLFSWDEVPGNDDKKFRDFLRQNYNIDWVITAQIEKIESGKTIRVSSAEKSLSLRINDERSRVSLRTDHGRTDEFIIRKLNGELNVYEEAKVSLIINDGRTYKLLGKKENNKIKIYDGIWEEVDDFDSSRPQDNHFIVDREKGEIKFGDGLNGRVPSANFNIKVISYRVGGGEEGNIKAGYDWKIEGHYGLKISNYKPSTGGKGAESIEDAADRFIKELKVPYTAVTSQDFEYIAKNTPGLRVAEAKAIINPFLFSWNRIPGKDTGRLKEFLSQNFEIDWARTAEVKKNDVNNTINVYSKLNSLSLRLNDKTRMILKIDDGRVEEFLAREENSELKIYDNNTVHVAVIPYTPLASFENPPKPSKEFINAICKHLDKHRLLGTKIRVVPPVYIKVNINATILPLKGFDKEKLRQNIEKKLQEFLHPITGGDNKEGWQMGKIVSRSDIYDIIEKVEGIDCIVSLTLSGDKSSSPDEDGNLELNSGIATVYLGDITITII